MSTIKKGTDKSINKIPGSPCLQEIKQSTLWNGPFTGNYYQSKQNIDTVDVIPNNRMHIIYKLALH